MSSEKDRLRREIEYWTTVIKEHKSSLKHAENQSCIRCHPGEEKCVTKPTLHDAANSLSSELCTRSTVSSSVAVAKLASDAVVPCVSNYDKRASHLSLQCKPAVSSRTNDTRSCSVSSSEQSISQPAVQTTTVGIVSMPSNDSMCCSFATSLNSQDQLPSVTRALTIEHRKNDSQPMNSREGCCLKNRVDSLNIKPSASVPDAECRSRKLVEGGGDVCSRFVVSKCAQNTPVATSKFSSNSTTVKFKWDSLVSCKVPAAGNFLKARVASPGRKVLTCSANAGIFDISKLVVDSAENARKVSKLQLKKNPLDTMQSAACIPDHVQMKVIASNTEFEARKSRKVVLQQSRKAVPHAVHGLPSDLNNIVRRKSVKPTDNLVSLNKYKMIQRRPMNSAIPAISRGSPGWKESEYTLKVNSAVVPMSEQTLRHQMLSGVHVQQTSHVGTEGSKKSAKMNSSLLSLNKYKLVRKRQNHSCSSDRVQRGLRAKDGKALVQNNRLLSQAKYKLVRRKSASSNFPTGVEQSTSSNICERSANIWCGDAKASSVLKPKRLPMTSTPVTSSETSVTRNKKPSFKEGSNVNNKYKLVRRRLSGSNLPLVKRNPVKSISHNSPLSQAVSECKPMFAVSKYKLVQQHVVRRYSSLFKFRRASLTRIPRDSLTGKKGPLIAVQRKPSDSSSAFVRRQKSVRSFVSKYALKRSPRGSRYKSFNRSQGLIVNVAKTMRSRHQFPIKSQLKIDRRRSSLRRWRKSDANSSTFHRGIWPSNASRMKRLSWKNTEGAERNSFVKDGGSQSQVVASLLVQRSVHKLVVVQRRRSSVDVQKYCIYYNRFGRCNRGDRCPFIHDPDKVAVCTRFLRGTCKVDGCPFSHVVAPHKMPACQYFMRGVCVRDNCPYLHVKLASDAEPCLDFAAGVCPLGDECKKLHVLVCPDFTKTKNCPRGNKCPMRHVIRKLTKGDLRYCKAGEDNAMLLDQDPKPCDEQKVGMKLRKGSVLSTDLIMLKKLTLKLKLAWRFHNVADTR